jgi:hypothetical protein
MPDKAHKPGTQRRRLGNERSYAGLDAVCRAGTDYRDLIDVLAAGRVGAREALCGDVTPVLRLAAEFCFTTDDHQGAAIEPLDALDDEGASAPRGQGDVRMSDAPAEEHRRDWSPALRSAR